MNTLILLTDILEKIILLSLLGLSVWSFSIIISKKRELQSEFQEIFFEDLRGLVQSKQLSVFKEKLESHPIFVCKALKQGLDHLNNSLAFEYAIASYVKKERLRLEKGLSVLATLGANTPFLGLFGTVLGIIRSFAYLGSQSGSAAVMSGVSQALYATAMGLFVALPAVVFYNLYSKKIKDLIVWTDSLKDSLLAMKAQDQNGRT